MISHISQDTHPFNGSLSRTTWVSRYQKGKPILILLKQETVSGSGISWAICKSAPRSREITTPAPHHSVFYRPDALPVAQPTASKHGRLSGYSSSQHTYLSAMGTHMPRLITQCYLPPGRGDIPTLTPAKLSQYLI